MQNIGFWYFIGMIGTIIAILILVIILFLNRRKNLNSQYPINDERIRTIVQKSATVSFYIGLFTTAFFTISLIIAYEFFKISEFGAINALNIEILIMSISYLLIYRYYSKKGTI